MLRGDGYQEWNGNTMPDNRVIHYWDGEMEVGQWFAQEVDGYQGIAWDAYYLYGPDATWEDLPSPLIGSGPLNDREREPLNQQVSSLVK